MAGFCNAWLHTVETELLVQISMNVHTKMGDVTIFVTTLEALIYASVILATTCKQMSEL